MRSRRWFEVARVIGAAVALPVASCSTDPGAPPRVGVPLLRLEKIAGDNQPGVVGRELPTQVEVRVVDKEGDPVRDQAVSFVIYSGGGSVAPTTATSDQDGLARARWTLGTGSLSAQQVSARLLKPVTGGLVDAVTFAATAEAGPAATMVKESGDLQAAQAGRMLEAPLVVVVRDEFGNVKPATAVTWTVLSGAGTPSSPVTSTDGAGRTWVRFTLGPQSGAQSVRASVASGASVAFALTAFARATLEGIVERSEPLSSRPYALAISSQDVVFVTQLDNQRVSRIDLPALGEAASVRVGSIPTDVSFNGTGTRAYVANQFSKTVSIIDVATNSEVSTLSVLGDPFEVIPDATDTRLYVVTNANRLFQLDRATGSILGSVALPGTGQSLVFHPNGNLLYVSTFTGGSVLEVDTRTMTVTRAFTTGGLAQEVVISVDGTELFVTDQTQQKVDVFSLATGLRLASIPVGGNAWGLAMTPDQRHLYVGLLFQGQVAVIDRTARAVMQRITTGGVPRRIAFNQAGTLAVVANESGSVTYIR
jgi:YVTN family beta-propeller protein